MSYLTTEAVDVYLQLTEYNLRSGVLAWSIYLERLQALLRMCNPESHIYSFIKEALLSEDANIEEDDWFDVEENQIDGSKLGSENNITNSNSNQSGIRKNRNKNYYYLCLKSGLKEWEVHQYDVDFHPSIPHGHRVTRNNHKLDVYLGWIYEKSKQIDRVPRNKIINLWNDEEFRIVALTAINWYSDKFRDYGWRVAYPRRLPRRRK